MPQHTKIPVTVPIAIRRTIITKGISFEYKLLIKSKIAIKYIDNSIEPERYFIKLIEKIGKLISSQLDLV